MKRDAKHGTTWWKRAVRAAFATTVVGAAMGGAGCLSRPIGEIQPRTTETETDILTQTAVDKIDILLMIDNSASMADKQAVLADAVPILVSGLLNPKCVDNTTNVPIPTAMQPGDPQALCPTGSKRDFPAVFDVHIGIVSSSLGTQGAQAGSSCDGSGTLNDAGHLVVRASPDKTYQGKGFLAWDPKQKLSPAGVGDLITLGSDLTDLVKGVGQDGCGYEASLESWYRFLVDPAPYGSIEFTGGKAVQSGKDNALLAQRKDFMRSDSLLAIIMLTDENDCSVRAYSYYPSVVAPATDSGDSPVPAARPICATDPGNKCCTSCGLKVAAGCDDTPCTDQSVPDLVDLRCYHNKQRFGIDFLYPIERYEYALTKARIPNPHPTASSGGPGDDLGGDLVENPIFSANGNGSTIRDTSLVFIAGIVGVPWQDIANDPTDLKQGFKDYKAMSAGALGPGKKPIMANGKVASTWDVIIGDPENFKDPLDPHMIESEKPRTGTDPITGTSLAGVDSAPGTDPINGHEWVTTLTGIGDLQYACAFTLVTPKMCTDASGGGCDCGTDNTAYKNPLCDPADYNSQPRAKGYPGIRELQLLKAVNGQGIVGSICPAQLEGDKSAPDYGYNPAIQGIINRLKTALGGACLAKELHPDKTGEVACLIIEARKTDDCSCAIGGHSKVDPAHAQAVTDIKATETAKNLGLNCFCEITETTSQDNDLQHCLQDNVDPPINDKGQPVNGWCYVDSDVEKVNPEFTKTCPADRKRVVRFVGEGKYRPGSTTYVTCSGDD